MSFTSDQLDESSYSEAPWDITTEHPKLGFLIVATAGTLLPHTSKYKGKTGCDTVARFRVGQDLAVTIDKERIKPNAGHTVSVMASLQGSGSDGASSAPACPSIAASGSSPASAISQLGRSQPSSPSTWQKELTVEVNRRSLLDVAGPSSQLDLVDDVASEKDFQSSPSSNVLKSPKTKYRSTGEFLMNVDVNFESIVIEGLESGLRGAVIQKLMDKKNLNEKENMAIVHSVNQAVFDNYGAARPDPKFCQQLGEILKKKFPGTYGIEEFVETDFGPKRLPTLKGTFFYKI